MNPNHPTGSRHFFSEDMAEPEIVSVAGGSASVYSHRCPEKNSGNEDAAAVVPFGDTAAVLIVADGLGGSALGEKAARLAIEAITAAISTAIDDENSAETILRTAILNGLENANTSVRSSGGGGATTVAIVEINNGMIRPYHVGDSGILTVGGRGKVKLQTLSHSPVGYGVEAGLIDDSQALHHEDRHIVSNVIGMENMRIDIGPPLKFCPRDTVLLASDGVFDNFYVHELVERIRKGPLSDTATALRDAVNERMVGGVSGLPSKPDDMTFIIFRQP